MFEMAGKKFFMSVNTKCIYETDKADNGIRILVTTYWPRGIKKERIDRWEKELGTPPDLIKRWKSGSIDWTTFSKKYLEAIKSRKDKIKELGELAGKEDITLLCTCREDNLCHRKLLKRLIEKRIGR